MTEALHEIELAVEALRRGEIVGIPTDTVYGLAVTPLDPAALERLYAAKGRALDVPVSLLVADIEQATVLGIVDGTAALAAERHWPGGLTLVVRRSDSCPPHLGDVERGTIGLRAPDQAEAQALLRAFGPLAVSSANRSGEPSAVSAKGARSVFGDSVARYVDGVCGGTVASTVVDYTVEPAVVLRRGPVDID